MDRILAAPPWLLIPAALVLGTFVVLTVTPRGRLFLKAAGRAARRPVAAVLIAAVVAGFAALFTTMAITCIHLHPFLVNLKGAGSVFFFGLFIGLPVWVPVILVWSMPVFCLIWLPLWMARLRLAFFWRWPVAPILGGAFTYASWMVIQAVYPLFSPDYQHRELVAAAHVAAFVNGVCMFSVGCIRRGRKRRAIQPPPATQL